MRLSKTYLEEKKLATAALLGTLGGIGLGALSARPQNVEVPQKIVQVSPKISQELKAPEPKIEQPSPVETNTQSSFQFSHPHIASILGAIAQAEHRNVRNLDHTVFNPAVMIRTKAGKGTSSAFGSYQLTKNTVADHFKRRPELFKDNEEYVNKFLLQGSRFLRANTKHSKYGLGGSGDLSGQQHHESYMKMADSVLRGMMIDSDINYKDGISDSELNSVIQRWRGVPESQDPKYYQTIKTKFNQNNS